MSSPYPLQSNQRIRTEPLHSHAHGAAPRARKQQTVCVPLRQQKSPLQQQPLITRQFTPNHQPYQESPYFDQSSQACQAIQPTLNPSKSQQQAFNAGRQVQMKVISGNPRAVSATGVRPQEQENYHHYQQIEPKQKQQILILKEILPSKQQLDVCAPTTQQQQQQQLHVTPVKQIKSQVFHYQQQKALSEEELALNAELKAIKLNLESNINAYHRQLSEQRMSADQISSSNVQFQDKLREIYAEYQRLPQKYPTTLTINLQNLPSVNSPSTRAITTNYLQNCQALLLKHLKIATTSSRVPTPPSTASSMTAIPTAQKLNTLQSTTDQSSQVEYSPIVRMHLKNDDIFASDEKKQSTSVSQFLGTQSDSKTQSMPYLQYIPSREAETLDSYPNSSSSRKEYQQTRMSTTTFYTDEKVKRTKNYEMDFLNQPLVPIYNSPENMSNQTLLRHSDLICQSIDQQLVDLDKILKKTQQLISGNLSKTTSKDLEQWMKEERYSDVCEYAYATLSDMDLRISKVHSIINKALETSDMNLTKTLLLEIVEHLRKVLNNSEDPETSHRAVSSIQRNATRILKDKSASYSLYLYLQKIAAFLKERSSVLISQIQAREELKTLDSPNESFWQETKIDNEDPQQITPILARVRNDNSMISLSNPFAATESTPLLMDKFAMRDASPASVKFFLREHLNVPDYVPIKEQQQKREQIRMSLSQVIPPTAAVEKQYSINMQPSQSSIYFPTQNTMNTLHENHSNKKHHSLASICPYQTRTSLSMFNQDFDDKRSQNKYSMLTQPRLNESFGPLSKSHSTIEMMMKNTPSQLEHQNSLESASDHSSVIANNYHSHLAAEQVIAKLKLQQKNYSNSKAQQNQEPQESSFNVSRGNEYLAKKPTRSGASSQVSILGWQQQQQIDSRTAGGNVAVVDHIAMNHNAAYLATQSTASKDVSHNANNSGSDLLNKSSTNAYLYSPYQAANQSNTNNTQVEVSRRLQFDSESQDTDRKMRFFDLAVQVKDGYPKDHKARSVLVSSLWDVAKNLNESAWRDFCVDKCQQSS